MRTPLAMEFGTYRAGDLVRNDWSVVETLSAAASASARWRCLVFTVPNTAVGAGQDASDVLEVLLEFCVSSPFICGRYSTSQ